MTPFSRGTSQPLVPVGLLDSLRAQQQELRSKVVVEDDLGPLADASLLAGVDVGFEEDGRVARAAVAVLRAGDMAVVEGRIARMPCTLPYIPGFLSFRELPAIIAALRMVEAPIYAVLVDGLGIAHPRRLGIASHLGVALDIPTIGVAKSILVGEHAPLPPEEGACVPLMHKGEQVGTVMRTKVKCNPLIASPGHRVSFTTASRMVRDCLRGYRLPEPTRLADRLTNARYRAEGLLGGAEIPGLREEYRAP